MDDREDVTENRGIVAACCGRKLGELHAKNCSMYPLTEDVPKKYLIICRKKSIDELDCFKGPIKDAIVHAYEKEIEALEADLPKR